MGAVIDYFRPIQGKTYCEMLRSHKFHQWSSDGSNWVTPKYYHHRYGGSAKYYPNDGRQYLSFWGGYGNQGGCCATSYGNGASWQQSFQLFYVTGMSHSFNIGKKYFQKSFKLMISMKCFSSIILANNVGDCSCLDYKTSQGYGKCKKVHPSYKSKGTFCYVNLPSTCSDVRDSQFEEGKKFAWEPCKSKIPYLNMD